MYDLVLPGGIASSYPSCSEFIEYLLPQLATLIQESGSGLTNDCDSYTMRCGPSLGLPDDLPSTSPLGAAVFDERLIPSMRSIPKPSLNDSDNLAKVLSAVNNNGSPDISLIGPLVSHLASLEPSSLLTGRDTKDSLKVAGKMKLRDNCDISGEVICEPVGVLTEDSIIDAKSNIHDNHLKSPMNGFFGGSEERRTTVRLMNTVCRWLVGQMGRCYNGITPEMYRSVYVVFLFTSYMMMMISSILLLICKWFSTHAY